jgi:hypothetical protein
MNSNRSENFSSHGLEGNDRRAAAIRAEEERAQLRHSRIEAQSSPFATPQERIRLWEELHGLKLPRDRDHRLVRVIAANTALTVQDVHDEQTRRHGPPLEAAP